MTKKWNNHIQHHCLCVHLILHHEVFDIFVFFYFPSPWWFFFFFPPCVVLLCSACYEMRMCIIKIFSPNNHLLLMLPHYTSRRPFHHNPQLCITSPLHVVLSCCPSASCTTTKEGYIAIQISSQTTKKKVSENPQL